MSYWKSSFLKSLEPDFEEETDFEFASPATIYDFANLERHIAAKIPEDIRSLLSEFNGIKRISGNDREPYFFSTQEMPAAAEIYRKWDQPTKLLMDCSRDILFVCQVNGFSEMWGVAVRPFGSFEYGQIVAFDHDMIGNAEQPDELFASPYFRLIDLVEANWKEVS